MRKPLGKMDHEEFVEWLESNGACDEGISLVKKHKATFVSAYLKCPYPFWFEWLVETVLRQINENLVILFYSRCIEYYGTSMPAMRKALKEVSDAYVKECKGAGRKARA